jgi:beta-lysine 5,6-aminomutase alpha subunit
MSGDIFAGLAMDTLFNFASKATGQGIHLLGMLTEAIHTPFMMDRAIAVDDARYVMKAMASFGDDIEFRKDGIMARRARDVLDRTLGFLRELEGKGLINAIAVGMFADMARPKDGGKGLDGLVEKDPSYWNPVERRLAAALPIR